MTIKCRIALLCIAAMTFSSLAQARSIRVDETLQLFDVSGVTNDGSSSAIDIQSYNTFDDINFVASDPLPFNVNVFGTSYSSFYVNENGSISFGGGFSGRPGNSDPANAGVPVFAPFLADVDSSLGGTVSHGFFTGENEISITWSDMSYLGQAPGDNRSVTMQIIIRDISSQTGALGDFRIEFNHGSDFDGSMQWETGDLDGGTNGLGGMSALAGFWDGSGVGYELPGSGVNGGLLGDGFCSGPNGGPACFDFDFEFRSGIAYFADGTPIFPVDEPPLLALLFMGLCMLARRRSIGSSG